MTSSVTLHECRTRTPWYVGAVEATADRVGVDPRALAVHSLLHLPRIAAHDGTMPVDDAEAVIVEQAGRLGRHGSPHAAWQLADLSLVVNPPDGDTVFRIHHYLHSVRQGAVVYALADPDGFPVVLAAVAPLEWRKVAGAVARLTGTPGERILDITRVYAHPGAPPNSISFLLGKIRRLVDADVLVTAVDPNLGFTGSSYRAANWGLWASVSPRPYLYRDGAYVTPRQLRDDCGSANLDDLNARGLGVFERSVAPLADSLIFGCRTSGPGTPLVPQRIRR